MLLKGLFSRPSTGGTAKSISNHLGGVKSEACQTLQANEGTIRTNETKPVVNADEV